MAKKPTEAECARWQRIWRAARMNMPKRHKTNTGWVMLGLLLFGKPRLGMKVYNLSYVGKPPKEENLQQLLILFSGPYGKVFARATMLKRSIDPNKFIWN